MRFFHLSDLHIGLKLMNHDLSEDQKHVFAQAVEYARTRKPDAIVIAGDIYDKAIPSAEAVELFDDFVTKLREAVPQAEIMMISGNHDSGARVNVFRSILAREQLHMIGLPPRTKEERIEKVTLKDDNGPVHFWLLPFVKPSMVRSIVAEDTDDGSLSYEETLRRLLAREEVNTKERNVLVSHQFFLPAGGSAEDVERMDSEVATVGNVDAVSASILEPFDYVALGHIHKPMKVGADNIRYCGTPLACSVSEAGQQKGIIEVTLDEKSGGAMTAVLPFRPLHEVRILKGTLEELTTQPTEDYVTVVLTDKEEHASLDLQDRLYNAFPNLLEIRRENVRMADYHAEVTAMTQSSPYEFCMEFLKDLTEEEKAVLRDVINTVQGVE